MQLYGDYFISHDIRIPSLANQDSMESHKGFFDSGSPIVQELLKTTEGSSTHEAHEKNDIEKRCVVFCCRIHLFMFLMSFFLGGLGVCVGI